MKSRKQKPKLMLLLVAGMLVMLPLLAVLQYRWLGEVSQAERERMQVNLKTSAERFCADFDRELTAIYTQIQSLSEPNLHQPAAEILSADFAARYSHWLAANPKTKLISGVYRTGYDAEGRLALAQFKNDSGLFQLVEWPEKLLPLRQRFEAQRQSNDAAHTTLRQLFGNREQWQSSGKTQGFFLKIQTGITAGDIPALVIPDAHSPNLQPAMERKSVCTIVALNAEFIKNELLPLLAKRYFSTDGESEFNLAVVRRGDANDLIYGSNALLPFNAFEKSDAQSSFFKIRPDDADRILIRNVRAIAAPAEPVAPPSPGSKKARMVSPFEFCKLTWLDNPATLRKQSALNRYSICQKLCRTCLQKNAAGSCWSNTEPVRWKPQSATFAAAIWRSALEFCCCWEQVLGSSFFPAAEPSDWPRSKWNLLPEFRTNFALRWL